MCVRHPCGPHERLARHVMVMSVRQPPLAMRGITSSPSWQGGPATSGRRHAVLFMKPRAKQP